MARVFKPDPAGFKALRSDPEIVAECYKYASTIQGQLGSDWSIRAVTWPTGSRSGYVVEATNWNARRDNYKNNVLEKAIGAAKR